MTTVAKTLFQGLQVPAAETTLYTAPANTRTILDKVTGTNTTASAAAITVKIIASGGSASAANTITSARAIGPGESYTFPELVGHVLNVGDVLSGLAGTASAISMRGSGREVT